MFRFILTAVSVFVLQASICQIIPADRDTDWSMAGLRDTTTSGFSIIDLGLMGIQGDSLKSNDSVLKIALDSIVPSGKIIVFPEGVFLFDSTISIVSNTLLRGKGSATKLVFDLNGYGNSIEAKGQLLIDTSKIVSTAVKDSFELIIHDPSLFSAGDWIRIIQNDSLLVTSDWAEGTIGQIVQIDKVLGSTLHLNSPLRLSFNILNKPYIQKIEPVKNIGIECLRLLRLDNTAPSQRSPIHFSYAVNCWISGIESENCTFSHVDCRYSSNIEISHSYFHHGLEYGGGGRAYGVTLHLVTGECLVRDNIFEHLRHSMLLQAGANGNVLAYNYSFDPNRTEFPSDAGADLVLHGNYPHHNLFEGNVCQSIGIDNSHGPNGPYNTFFRNRADLYGVRFGATNSPSQNFVSNDVTNTGFPYSAVNYNILGTDHFIFGNNNKGDLDPPGSSSVLDASLYYPSRPAFVWPKYWSSIGSPNALGSGSNLAEYRESEKIHLGNSCGNQIDTTIEDTTTHLIILERDFLIYPNPATQYVTIQCNECYGNVELISNTGAVMLNAGLSGQKKNVNVSGLPSGVYTVKFANRVKKLLILKR